jgi:hypothetical protein
MCRVRPRLTDVHAGPASWLLNSAFSGEAGLEPEKILGTLSAIAHVIGTVRIVSAAGGFPKASHSRKLLLKKATTVGCARSKESVEKALHDFNKSAEPGTHTRNGEALACEYNN